MTKEEAKEFGLNLLHGILARNEKSDPSYANLVKEAIDALSQPSLPSNLEEAVGKYLELPETNSANQWEDLMIYHAFIDGAKWMAEQGETQEHFVIGTIADSPCGPAIVCYTNKFEIGNEVIVQIRKKDN